MTDCCRRGLRSVFNMYLSKRTWLFSLYDGLDHLTAKK